MARHVLTRATTTWLHCWRVQRPIQRQLTYTMSIRRVSYRRNPWSARPVPGVLVFDRRFQMSVPRVRRPAFRAPGRPVGQQACPLARMSDRLVSHPCRVKAMFVFAIRHFVRLLHSCALALRRRTGSAKFVIRVSNGPRRPGRTPTITTSPDDPDGPLTGTAGPRRPRPTGDHSSC